MLKFRPYKNFSQNSKTVNGRGRVGNIKKNQFQHLLLLAGRNVICMVMRINRSLRVLRNFSAMGTSN